MPCFGLTSGQLYIFVLGWFGYAVTYLLRKSLGIVKGDMQNDLGFSSNALGWMDMALILPYAVFQMAISSVGDRIGAGYTFGICLTLDGCVMCTFGWWSSLPVFLLLLALNGACQSICWPNATKVLGTWFPSGSSRSSVFGVFGTSAFAGAFVGTALVVYLQTTYSWRSAFLLPSLIVSMTGTIVMLTFKEAPDAKTETQGAKTPSSSPSRSGSSKWSSLWSIRAVPEVAMAALCIKVVRYAFYGWLPLYLYQHLKYSKGQAGMFSTMFDIGGVFGSAFIGAFINRFFQGRAIYGCMVGIGISTLSLGFFMVTSSWGVVVHSTLLLIAGAFNCGPDTILVSLVSSDLGNRDGRDAAAAVTGLINGFGSLGSVIQGPIVGWLLGVTGWNSVLFFMVATSALGTLVALRATVIDARTSNQPRHSPSHHSPSCHAQANGVSEA